MISHPRARSKRDAVHFSAREVAVLVQGGRQAPGRGHRGPLWSDYYRGPTWAFTLLAEFDGSVIAERKAGELSPGVTTRRRTTSPSARARHRQPGEDGRRCGRYDAKAFLDYRRRLPNPYMEKRRFEPGRNTLNPDVQLLSDDDLLRAVEEGESSARQAA
jgi:hypothetical protein